MSDMAERVKAPTRNTLTVRLRVRVPLLRKGRRATRWPIKDPSGARTFIRYLRLSYVYAKKA